MKDFLTLFLVPFTASFGGSKGGGGSTQTIQKADPWSGAQPYISDYLKKGQQTSARPFDFYDGDTIAGFAPEQELGFNLTTQRALAGSPTLNAANTSITDTLNGNYLSPDSNPYFKGTVDRVMGDVTSRVNSVFNNSNFGGSAHQEVLQRGLGDVANNMYSNNYNSERSRQMQAATQAPTLANADYMDSQYLQGVGAQRRGLSQAYLDDAKGIYNQASEYPYVQMARYSDSVRAGQGVGGTTTTTGTQQQASSPMAGALGGGLAGYGIASQLPAAWGVNPWIGAGVGLLGGLLG